MSALADGPAGDALPDAVRQRAVAAAASVLGALPSADVPSTLRRVAQFAPARRARLGAGAIMDALATDPLLRQRTAEAMTAERPDLARVVRAGAPVADPDLVDAAALAYLLRTETWPDLVARAELHLRERADHQAEARRDAAVQRLTEQLDAVRAAAREEVAAVQSRLDAARADVTRLRQRLGAARDEARTATRAVADAEARAQAVTADAANAAEAEIRRLRARVAELEQALESARRATREHRVAETVRTRLLVDTLVDAARGLRQELALPPATTRPADLVAGGEPARLDRPASRGRDADDPALLEQLLAVPQVHLVVDGYNVTKAGYGELQLAEQRARLVTALGSLAARTSAEITCVFDGAELAGQVPVASARRVRVLFSQAGTSADDLIREIVAAEPVGRPVVVVTNDGEILRDVRLAGAWTAGSTALLRMLGGR